MKQSIITLLLLLVTLTIGAQTDYSNMILSYSENREIFFHKYEPNLIIKAEYSSITEAENNYPEQLIQSILSATNQEWINYNTLGGAEKATEQNQSHFDRVLTMDKNKNFFKLHHKLTFTIGNIPTAIIKFFIHQEENEPVSGAVVMQKVDGRWQHTSNPTLSTLSIIVMRLKTTVLQGILLNDSEDKDIIALSKRVSSESGLDLQKLEDEFMSWYNPELDRYKIEMFIDPKAW
ncbi:hypothetical protein SAMN04487911_1425 [Arenibacter nanhaiticus]|uniref:Uncharacterized protein n=1 Tax=Arenibacter nanhaiticus TaxID=558155 RepID=A0A1M6MI50_9FLAO|nr:hypothetical protein [Arenibacter nanhaiticus]SHJ83086.1 hypothetical protein SAMN04487911_1425 [Arenibacter nanhaiticus]